MKATHAQIAEIVRKNNSNNTELYNAVKLVEDAVISEVGTEVKKTQHYFTESDWTKVYSEIKKRIS